MKENKKLILLSLALAIAIIFGGYKAFKYWNTKEETQELFHLPTSIEKNNENKAPDFSFGTDFRSTPEVLTYPSQTIDSDACTPLSQRPTLRAQLNNFKCSEGILDSGFDRCTAIIDYEIQYYCKPKATSYAELYCELSYETQTPDSYVSSRATADERTSLYLNGTKHDFGTLEMQIRLISIMSPIVRVKPLDLSCRVTSY